MEMKELQIRLDKQKWDASVAACRDMCGFMPYCPFCNRNEEYPCAKAFLRAEEAAKVKEESDKATTAEATQEAPLMPVKRGRGRPLGSKNKPKDPNPPPKRSPGRPRKNPDAVVVAKAVKK